MKTFYYTETGGLPAVADLAYWDGPYISGWVVHRINVPTKHRGKGLGTKLLEEILADADQEGVTLLLAPEASGGLSQTDLEEWYQRHGFAWTRSGAMLERKPNETGK